MIVIDWLTIIDNSFSVLSNYKIVLIGHSSLPLLRQKQRLEDGFAKQEWYDRKPNGVFRYTKAIFSQGVITFKVDMY